MLTWHSLPYRPQDLLVVGTYLAAAFVEGHGKRFAVYERRSRAWDEGERRYYPSVSYCVKDAERSSDDAIRKSILPPTVFVSDDLDACVGYVQANSYKEPICP